MGYTKKTATTTAVATTTEERKPVRFAVAIKDEKYQQLINDTLGDKEIAKRFVAEISTVVGNNYKLSQCTANSIISAGLLGQSLKLPLAPSFGFCYLVPYKNKQGFMLAQFQVGWKGIVQLALRTGQYETLGVRIVHEGEVCGQNEFGEDVMHFDHQYDNNKVVGYFAYFKLLSGFKKTLYWTVEQCEKHGERYSQAHRGDNKGGENDRWATDFNDMALKTVLKQLVSKWGIMSVELQQVFQADQAVIDNGKYVYVDNDGVVEEKKDKVPAIKNRLSTPKEKEPEVEATEPDIEVETAI